jgi:hypothetical protein
LCAFPPIQEVYIFASSFTSNRIPSNRKVKICVLLLSGEGIKRIKWINGISASLSVGSFPKSLQNYLICQKSQANFKLENFWSDFRLRDDDAVYTVSFLMLARVAMQWYIFGSNAICLMKKDVAKAIGLYYMEEGIWKEEMKWIIKINNIFENLQY